MSRGEDLRTREDPMAENIPIDYLKHASKNLAVQLAVMELQIHMLEVVHERRDTLQRIEISEKLGRRIAGVTSEDLRGSLLSSVEIVISVTKQLLSTNSLAATLKLLEDVAAELRAASPDPQP